MNKLQPITPRQRFERVLYFFPLQLLFLHFKKNLFLLFFWVVLFSCTLNYFAANYGVAYQFLFPEYMGENGPVAFAMVGFALGGFILAFNLYTYILHGFRFPFIATLNRPFLKFSINNLILPGSFVVTYLMTSIRFQASQELLDKTDIFLNVLGFCFGMFAYLLISLAYFTLTNKNVINYEAKSDAKKKGDPDSLVKSKIHKNFRWYVNGSTKKEWRVETYLQNFARIGLARTARHYNRELLERVFTQNHFNASIFEMALVISFIVIGSFRESPYFVLPAAASVMLLFTMMLMVISALYSWIRGWTAFVFVIVFLGVNFALPDNPILNAENHAYGLKYDGEKADYSPEYISSINSNDSIVVEDFEHTLEILNRWRKKNQSATNLSAKPKLVIINTSGGGSRSAMWTMSSLMYADSVLDGKLLEQTFLISGSSGGMVGAAYLRELMLNKKQGKIDDLYNREYISGIGRDLLNPVIFSIATNDFFIRYQTIQDGDQWYTKDRAWAFEKQLNTNTNYLMNKRLGDYSAPEEAATIPMMIFSPTIVNDGRRLLISAQPCSYLTQNKPISGIGYTGALSEDIEFGRVFAKQNPMNLQFTSALRMNATFPYVLPIVSLPSEPPMEVMDAGMRDNFGTKTTLQFLYTFRNWINTNTSGVVIVQVRDLQKGRTEERSGRTLLNRVLAPLGSVYGNVTKTQDYNGDQMIRYLSAWFDNSIDIVSFQLKHKSDTQVSLSWHLTSKEKETILNSLDEDIYQESLARLKKLLEQ